MTELVVVERSFPEPADFRELQAREAAVAWCLERHGVHGVCSFIADDSRRAVCLYRAPDAEAVRATQRTGGIPLDHVWAADVLGDVELALREARVVIVQRELEQPITLAHMTERLSRDDNCMSIHRVAVLASHLSRDGRRMVCAYTAPDAETVRIVNRQMDLAFTRVWPAAVMVEPAR